MLSKLLPLIPAHRYYLEPFGGSAALLIAKDPAPFEVYNDIDKKLYTFYKVLRDKEKFQELQRLLELTPYHREAQRECSERVYTAEDELEVAYCFFVSVSMGFSGKIKSGFSHALYRTTNSTAETVSRYLSSIERLPAIHARLRTVQVECQDWRVVVERYNEWGAEGFYYLDPPYILETRRGTQYDHELSSKGHEELVEWLIHKARVQVLLSGYDNPTYRRLEEAGWRKICFDVACHAAGRTRRTGLLGEGATYAKGQRRQECVWMNYTPQAT